MIQNSARLTPTRERCALRGFTLIELLVVIAIIGVLSSVVLGQLSSARNKGADAAVTQNISGIRPQAELFYDVNDKSYVGTVGGTTDVCSPTGLVAGVRGIYPGIRAAAQVTMTNPTIVQNSAAQVGTAPLTGAACHASASAWAVSAPTKTGGIDNTYYCVDSTGNAKGTDVALGINVVACP